MVVTIFKDLFKSKDVPYHVSLEKVINRIKNGDSVEIVKKVRNAPTKIEADKIKEQLPCVLFNGTFSERNSNSLIQHSGLMIVDFDKYPNDDEMMIHLDKLKQNKHFVLLFISPSGKGIKGVVKVSNELDKISHPKVFSQFQDDFNFDYWDKSNSNIDRVCFESYDPNIYVNFDAEIYNPVIKDKGFDVRDRTPLLPINDEEKIIDKIMQWNWKKDFREGERNSFIFDLAGAFCEYGISENTAEGYILNNIVIGDFPDREAITTIKSAYKKRIFDSKFFEDYNKIDKIKSDLKKGKKEVIKKYGISEDTYDELKEAQEHDDFWFLNDKNKISINPFKYKLFLERNGFKKHFPNESDKPQFVYIQSNKVRLTSVSKIKDFVLDYLIERKEFDVWNYCANYQMLFSETYLLMLESIDLMMLKDERKKSFLAFQNGILEITDKEIKLIDYIDVDGYVWESNILNRNFVFCDDFTNDYQKFIYNISAQNPFPIECTIGYLLSTYKNRSNVKAVILNDEIISDNPEGGTGKGLFVQGLSHIRNTSIIDGKQFDSKKSFAYQTVSLDTKILVFDDVKKNFDFEDKFSIVSEGLTLERKNKDAVKLNVHESPKIVMSTNYAIKGEGNSHNRRRHEIEIAQYYGKDLTPDEEFGKQLFDEWDLEEFQRFDNYMVNCLQMFLKSGLMKQNAKNIKLRKFIAETNMDFYEWIIDAENFPINMRNDKSVYFNAFINDNKDYDKWLKRNRFNIWIQKYASFMDYRFEQGNSNGLKWFGIFEKNVQNVEQNDDDFIF